MVNREEFIKKAKAGVQKAFSRRDLLIMQAVRSVDDLDETKNTLFTRVLDWTKFNFPEIDISNEETLCAVIGRFGVKENFDYTALAEIVGDNKATELMEAAENSYGAEFKAEDIKPLRELAAKTRELYIARKELEKYVELAAKQIFPNICELIDPLLTGRMITTAGGLERFAKMPGSTIQVLGAEKALFKHLHKGSKPPKHGLLFQSPLVRDAKEDRRGRIARALAAKLAIAAKADFYTHNSIGAKLRKDLDERISKIE